MKATILFIAAVSAGNIIADSNAGVLLDPPPRPITDDFRSNLPPTLRGLPERDLQKLPNGYVTKKYGRDTAKNFKDFTGTCAGVPRKPGRYARAYLDRPMRFSWNVEKSASDARCTLTLNCPAKSIEKELWSGDCRDAKKYSQNVTIGKEIGRCEEGECFIQWKMETKADKYCNCVDVVVEAPKTSVSISSSTSILPVTSSSIYLSTSIISSSSSISSSSLPTLTSKILIPTSSTIMLSSSSALLTSSSVIVPTSTASISSLETSSSSSIVLVSTSTIVSSWSSSSSIAPTSSLEASSSSSTVQESSSTSVSSINSIVPTSIVSSSSLASSSIAPTSVSESILESATSTSTLPVSTQSTSITATIESSAITEKINPVTPTISSKIATICSSEFCSTTCSSCSNQPTSTCSTCTAIPTFTSISSATLVTEEASSTVPQLTTMTAISSQSPSLVASITSIPRVTVTEKRSSFVQTVIESTAQCPMPSTATSTLNISVTITEPTTVQSVVTVTSLEPTTLVSITTENITATLTSAQIERITATETLVSMQTSLHTATVTEKAASQIPETLISTMILTEKMAPVTIFATSIKSGQITTMTATERIVHTSHATHISTINATCVPSLITSIVTKNHEVTLTQNNLMTVKVPIEKVKTATVTKISSAAAIACPLQVKTITRLITPTSVYVTPSTSVYIAKVITPTSVNMISITSFQAFSGSICPTPTVSARAISNISVQPSLAPSSSVQSSGSCTEGQKRCDIYDRRMFNECKGAKWSDGIKLTEADNQQCQESAGTVKLVPISGSDFYN